MKLKPPPGMNIFGYALVRAPFCAKRSVARARENYEKRHVRGSDGTWGSNMGRGGNRLPFS